MKEQALGLLAYKSKGNKRLNPQFLVTLFNTYPRSAILEMSFEDLKDSNVPEILEFASTEENEELWEDILHDLKEVSEGPINRSNMFYAFLNAKNESTSLNELLVRLLKPKAGESIMNNSDYGTTLFMDYAHTDRLIGNPSRTSAQQLLKHLLDFDAEVIEKEYMEQLKHPDKYDIVFSMPETGAVLDDFTLYRDYLLRTFGVKTSRRNVHFAQAVFAVLENMASDGRAALVYPKGWLTMKDSVELRSFLVNRGVLEAIITLPENMLDNSNMPLAVALFSRNNRETRFIEAEDLGTSTGKKVDLTPEDIDAIVEMLTKDTERSVSADVETISRTRYLLNPSRFVIPDLEFENLELLKQLTHGIELGSYRKEAADEKAPTIDVQIINSENTSNSFIEFPLEGKRIVNYDDKKSIEPMDIVYARNPYPIQAAILEENKDGRPILARINSFVIKPDPEKIDPYYLLAYLNSNEGNNQIEKLSSTGGQIYSISRNELSQLQVPMMDMEEQKKIGQEYKEAMENVKSINKELDEAKGKLRTFFDDKLKEMSESES